MEDKTDQKSYKGVRLNILYIQLTEIRFSITKFFHNKLERMGDPENRPFDISDFPETT